MCTRMVHQPHDALAKAAFSREENAAGLLRAVLPAALLARLDLTTLRLLQGSYVDRDLRKTHSDLVYEVQLAGRPALVCLALHEHQSEVEDLMAVRFVGYLARAWDAWIADHPGATRVPPVIPIVLYHGTEPWSAPTSITDTLDAPAELIAAAGSYLPAWSFVLDDLNATTDDELRAREVGVFGRLALLLLKHARSIAGDDIGALLGFVRTLCDLLLALPDLADHARAICYIFEVVKDVEPATFLKLLSVATEEAREDVPSVADMLRLEGELRGLRRTLFRLLRSRFGAECVTPEVESRVSAATQDLLERWVDATVNAQAIEQVWAP
jgi:hypothetical protein